MALSQCRAGLHPMTVENIMVDSSGDRRCRACRAESKRRWRERHRPEHDAAKRRRQAERRLAKAAAGIRSTRTTPFIAGLCQDPSCGSSFVGTGLDSRYCSERCARRAPRRRAKRTDSGRRQRRAWHRKRGQQMGWREQIPVDVVAARDGWDCGICGLPTNPELEVPADLAPTTDHTIPLSRGGDHSIDNVQVAHFICNSAKQDLIEVGEIEEAVAQFATA